MVEKIIEGERMITDVCIVGGGPAGMMTGLLLAKQGLDVVVLERNPDFHREYRGEIHQPRFVQLMKELNLDEYIMKDVQLTINELKVFHENSEILHVPFDPFLEEDSHIIRLPQPTFLTALLQKASCFPNFKLLFNTAVKDLMFEGEKVIGVIAQSNDDMLPSQFKIKAAVTIGADGRNSIVAKKANFKLERDYYMNDLMWLIAEKPKFLGDDLYHFYFQKNFNYLFLSRLDGLIQYGISLERGEFNRIKEQGLDAFKQKILEDMPMLQPALDKVTDFKSFIPLNCKMIYVKEWAKEGCLVIGDAAHCMTPWGGVGTSLALGTAITAADVIYKGFMKNDLSLETLKEVQQRREKEVKMIQDYQIIIEKFLDRDPIKKELAPYLFRLVNKLPDAQEFHKNLFIMEGELGIHPDLVFTDVEKSVLAGINM